MAMILVVNKCKARLKRFTRVESIVFAHLHLNRLKFGTEWSFDVFNGLSGSFISHIELSLKNKARLDKL